MFLIKDNRCVYRNTDFWEEHDGICRFKYHLWSSKSFAYIYDTKKNRYWKTKLLTY